MKGKLRHLLGTSGGILLLCIFLTGLVIAIGTDHVEYYTPINATWTNEANYTAGFTGAWNMSNFDKLNYNGGNYVANCTLYVGNSSMSGGDNLTRDSYYSTNVRAHTNAVNDTVFNMTLDLKSLGIEGLYYWTIECYNSSLTPTSWYPEPRTLYFDNSTADWSVKLYIDGTQYTNASWTSATSAVWEVNVTENGTLTNEVYTITVFNASDAPADNATFVTDTTTNATAVNITQTLTDGNYTIAISVVDNAGNTNTTQMGSMSVGCYQINVDQTNPVVTFLATSSITDNDIVSYDDWIYINYTVIDAHLEDMMYIDLGGTIQNISLSNNCTTYSTDGYYCEFNFTDLTNVKNSYIDIFANDTAGNIGYSANWTWSLDVGETPVINATNNWTIIDSVINFNITIWDTTPTYCTARIYNSSNNIKTTITGIINDNTEALKFCTGTISASDISDEGAFTVEFNLTDGAGTSVTSNKSGVLKNLYDGWNLVTYTNNSGTVEDICASIEYCTKISDFNNSLQSFRNYLTSVPDTNNDTTINVSDPIYIYTSADDYLLMEDYLPTNQATWKYENRTLYDGWNIIGLLYNTTVNTTLYALTYNTSLWDIGDYPNGCGDPSNYLCNFTWVTKIDTDANKYLTCGRTAGICTGTSLVASQLYLPKGYAVWALVNDANRSVINMSRIIN